MIDGWTKEQARDAIPPSAGVARAMLDDDLSFIAKPR
jgi:hypothetical protein